MNIPEDQHFLATLYATSHDVQPDNLDWESDAWAAIAIGTLPEVIAIKALVHRLLVMAHEIPEEFWDEATWNATQALPATVHAWAQQW